MDVIIIEDEFESSVYLKEVLDDIGGINVLRTLDSVFHAIKWFQNNKQPDLVLMDVELADGQSFNILEEVKINCPIIFVTAYNEFALKAIKLSSLDYLLKPISPFDLSKALLKYYSKKIERFENIDLINSIDCGFKKRLLVKEGNQLLPVKVDEIAYVYWSEYAFLKKFDAKSYLINYSITQIEELLPQHLFFRVNRQILTNVNAIERLYKEDNSYYIGLLPKFDQPIKISKEAYGLLKRKFN